VPTTRDENRSPLHVQEVGIGTDMERNRIEDEFK